MFNGNDVTAYLVIEDFGPLGRGYVETDLAEADRETIIRNFISGQHENALRVVPFNTAAGWSLAMSRKTSQRESSIAPMMRTRP